MNTPTLCPACLTELPDDYPYDHVAIDLAAAGDTDLFHTMSRAERAETVTTALRRGMTLNQIAVQFHLPFAYIRDLMTGLKRRSEQHAEVQQQIRQLWAEGLSDGTIALRLNRNISTVAKIRWRMKLPANYGPRGRRLDHEAAA